MAKSTLYDGIPYYYVRDFFRDVYFLDDNFNLISQKDFGAYPTEISGGDGKYFVRAGSLWFSKGDRQWKLIDSEFSTPVSNCSGRFAAYKNGRVYLSSDGENFKPVKYYSVSPTYIDSIGDVFYYIKDNCVYVSRDGIYFKPVFSNEEIYSLGRSGDKLILNGIKYEIPIFDSKPYISTENEYIEYVGDYINAEGKSFVPIRAYASLTNGTVSWNSSDNTVILTASDTSKIFKCSDNAEDASSDTLWLNNDTSYIMCD